MPPTIMIPIAMPINTTPFQSYGIRLTQYRHYRFHSLRFRHHIQALGWFSRRVGGATTPGSAKSRADAASLFWCRTGWTARHPRRRNDGGRIRFWNWCRLHNFGVDTRRRLDHTPAGVQFVAEIFFMVIGYASTLRAPGARRI